MVLAASETNLWTNCPTFPLGSLRDIMSECKDFQGDLSNGPNRTFWNGGNDRYLLGGCSSSRLWALSILNVDTAADELIFKFYLILVNSNLNSLMWPVATTSYGLSVPFTGSFRRHPLHVVGFPGLKCYPRLLGSPGRGIM